MGPRAGPDKRRVLSHTGIRSPDRPARSQSLYRLRYPAHILDMYSEVFKRERSLKGEFSVQGQEGLAG